MIAIKGKWALVTGASRGIGKQIAVALAQLGCNMVLHSRSVAHTRALAEQLTDMGVHTVSLAADLYDPDQVELLISQIKSSAPQIDILYNNAAIMTPYHDDVWSIPDEEFRKSFEINVLSQIKLCNALLPGMMERRWGRVINLISGINEQPQLAPYAISKAALRKFVQDFVPILKDSGVAMNALDPGWLKTDMGGPDAPGSVESVIPGALVPLMLPHNISGKVFQAQDYAGMSISQAITRAEQY